MGAMFRWMRMLYLFFAAVTRRLVVFPDGEVPFTLVAGPAFGAAWADAAAGDIIVASVGDKAVRIYQIDISNPTGGAGVDYEVRIGYGTTAAPTWFGPVTMNLASVPLPFPLEVPAGQPLRAQVRDSAGGATVDVKILAYTIE